MRRDPQADIPARTIMTRGKIQKANFVSGSKTKGVVITESILESIAATGAELDPRVVSWTPQPFTIDLRSGETAATKLAMLDRFRGSPAVRSSTRRTST
jgi:hypothetical protein